MSYRLIVTSKAYDALDAYLNFIAVEQQAPLTASRWMKKALNALQTLKSFPNRCPFAPENDHYEYPVRMLIVDNCLFLFRVDEDHKTVRVFGFRHGHQRPLAGE